MKTPTLPRIVSGKGVIFLFFIFALFSIILNGELIATTKLKKLHRNTNLHCKDCHHKPKKNAPSNIEPTPSNKKCYLCHTSGSKKISKLNELPYRLRKMHRYCVGCHRRNNLTDIRRLLRKHLKKDSHCLLCH